MKIKIQRIGIGSKPDYTIEIQNKEIDHFIDRFGERFGKAFGEAIKGLGEKEDKIKLSIDNGITKWNECLKEANGNIKKARELYDGN